MFIVLPTIAIIIFLFLVVVIGFGEITLRLMRIQRLKRDQAIMNIEQRSRMDKIINDALGNKDIAIAKIMS